jgi:hypothetical protein
MASLDPLARALDVGQEPQTFRRGRYAVQSGLVAEFPSLRLTVPVSNLSRGGFAIRSHASFDPEQHHGVVLRCASDSTPMVTVRVAHARPDDRLATFVVGFQFLDADHARLRAAVTMIVRSLGLLDDGTPKESSPGTEVQEFR